MQISDLHIGNRLEGARLARMVERVNALDPTSSRSPATSSTSIRATCPRRAHLGALRARHGVFAILGNHDHYVGAERVAEALARHAPGVRLLRDELVRLAAAVAALPRRRRGSGRPLVRARPALRARSTRSRARWPGDGPVLLLVHQPEIFEHAAHLGFPLVLAGHTHGGQLALPLPGGHWNLARVMTPLTRGIYRSGGARCT